MNIEELSIKDKVVLLRSDLVSDYIGRLMHGGVFLNIEFILTIGEEAFKFLANCEADNIEFGNRIKRKYTEEERKEYTNKLISLDFMSPKWDEGIVDMDKVREFFDSCTDEYTNEGSRLVDEFIQEIIEFS